ncbi:hypothetical protein BC938DRAFT_472724 [Jimgerdemannia flammicorona]|uniref:Uncharacterized protein n=1 Tax=Jimgerdemannia flammicorona TaxID=994334 RepID=A0A433Q5H9_9FUNG|nr:hypothetical protein BC938DRAFT_472724 [Jimgerdemannia flammicorona]
MSTSGTVVTALWALNLATSISSISSFSVTDVHAFPFRDPAAVTRRIKVALAAAQAAGFARNAAARYGGGG